MCKYYSLPVSGKTQQKQTHKTLVSCGFEACLGGEGSACLLLLPKSCVVTYLFDSLLRTDTLLRGDAEQTLEVSNLSRRQRARVQGKILTTTLASASSSCFLSQTTAGWSWRSLRQCDPWAEKSNEVWAAWKLQPTASHSLSCFSRCRAWGKMVTFACSWFIAIFFLPSLKYHDSFLASIFEN